MNYKCIKCNEYKHKEGYDEKWFKVIKKICLKCEMLIKEGEIKRRMMKREMEVVNKKREAERKLSHILSSQPEEGFITKPTDLVSNKYGKVWMRKEDKTKAYTRSKYGGWRQYRSFRSKKTGKQTIKVKWSNKQTRYYTLELMHSFIFP